MVTGTGWFSKGVFYSAVLMAVLLPLAAVGHKLGVLGLTTAFGMLRVCILGGLIVIIAAVVNLIIGKQKAQPERPVKSSGAFRAKITCLSCRTLS